MEFAKYWPCWNSGVALHVSGLVARDSGTMGPPRDKKMVVWGEQRNIIFPCGLDPTLHERTQRDLLVNSLTTLLSL